MKCIVCKTDTDKLDPAFKAGFCESADCVQQLNFGWNGIENARLFFRALYAKMDGSASEIPLNRLEGVKPGENFHLVRAAWYDK